MISQPAKAPLNIDRLLSAVIDRGFVSMEPCDLGDLIGSIIASGSLKEAEEIYQDLCRGIHHGIGLSHQQTNDSESINLFIDQWRQ